MITLSSKKRFDKKLDKIRDTKISQSANKKQSNRALRKLLNNRLAVIGGIVFAIIVIMCFFAPLFTSYDPLAIDMTKISKAPSMTNILGTDQVGRDIFTRILYGGRISIMIGFGSALGCAAVGVLLGCYSGFKGGLIDKVLVRISEVFMAFPQLILVLMLAAIIGRSASNIIFIFILTGWGSVFRMVRSQMLSIREEEYVQSLKVFGINDLIICYKHMMPNALGPILVNITLSTAMFILEEAALSYLGLGVAPEIATWGNILNSSQQLHTLQNYWWAWLPVGITISLFVMSINFVGDGLRDTTDPSQQG